EKRMADAAAQYRPIGQAPLESGRLLDTKAERSAARLLLSRMPQKKKRPPGRLGPEGKPPAFSQPEMRGITLYFQEGYGECSARQRRLGNPESLFQPLRQGMQHLSRIEPELQKARGIGQACLLSG